MNLSPLNDCRFLFVIDIFFFQINYINGLRKTLVEHTDNRFLIIRVLFYLVIPYSLDCFFHCIFIENLYIISEKRKALKKA